MLWVGEDQEISVDLMRQAAAIVDQCLQETELFNNQPADRALRYMHHINSVSQEHGEVTYKLSHAKATWKGGAHLQNQGLCFLRGDALRSGLRRSC